MALRNFKLFLSSLFLLTSILTVNSQIMLPVDSVFKGIYDINLNLLPNKKLLSGKKPIILVSLTPCSACVKYFSKDRKHFQFVFVIKNKSLLEVKRLTDYYQLKNKNIYFVTPDDLIFNKNSIITGPTPLGFIVSERKLEYIDYSKLNIITGEFTLPYQKICKAFSQKVN